MKETPTSNRIREAVRKEFGTELHKYHGGTYGETACADLFGTLPGGYAVFLEVKTEETSMKMTARRRAQEAWLAREAKLGACTGVVWNAPMALGLIKSYLSTRRALTVQH